MYKRQSLVIKLWRFWILQYVICNVIRIWWVAIFYVSHPNKFADRQTADLIVIQYNHTFNIQYIIIIFERKGIQMRGRRKKENQTLFFEFWISLFYSKLKTRPICTHYTMYRIQNTVYIVYSLYIVFESKGKEKSKVK